MRRLYRGRVGRRETGQYLEGHWEAWPLASEDRLAAIRSLKALDSQGCCCCCCCWLGLAAAPPMRRRTTVGLRAPAAPAAAAAPPVPGVA